MSRCFFLFYVFKCVEDLPTRGECANETKITHFGQHTQAGRIMTKYSSSHFIDAVLGSIAASWTVHRCDFSRTSVCIESDPLLKRRTGTGQSQSQSQTTFVRMVCYFYKFYALRMTRRGDVLHTIKAVQMVTTCKNYYYFIFVSFWLDAVSFCCPSLCFFFFFCFFLFRFPFSVCVCVCVTLGASESCSQTCLA